MKVKVIAKNFNTNEVFEKEFIAVCTADIEDLEEGISDMACYAGMPSVYNKLRDIFARLLVLGFYELDDGDANLYIEVIQ